MYFGFDLDAEGVFFGGRVGRMSFHARPQPHGIDSICKGSNPRATSGVDQRELPEFHTQGSSTL